MTARLEELQKIASTMLVPAAPPVVAEQDDDDEDDHPYGESPKDKAREKVSDKQEAIVKKHMKEAESELIALGKQLGLSVGDTARAVFDSTYQFDLKKLGIVVTIEFSGSG